MSLLQEDIGTLENVDMCNLVNRSAAVVSQVPRMATIDTLVLGAVTAPEHGDSVVSSLADLVGRRQRFVAQGNPSGDWENHEVARLIAEGVSRAGKKTLYDGVKKLHDLPAKPTVEICSSDGYSEDRRHLTVADIRFNTRKKDGVQYLVVETQCGRHDQGGSIVQVTMRMDDVERYPSETHSEQHAKQEALEALAVLDHIGAIDAAPTYPE